MTQRSMHRTAAIEAASSYGGDLFVCVFVVDVKTNMEMKWRGPMRLAGREMKMRQPPEKHLTHDIYVSIFRADRMVSIRDAYIASDDGTVLHSIECLGRVMMTGDEMTFTVTRPVDPFIKAWREAAKQYDEATPTPCENTEGAP